MSDHRPSVELMILVGSDRIDLIISVMAAYDSRADRFLVLVVRLTA